MGLSEGAGDYMIDEVRMFIVCKALRSNDKAYQVIVASDVQKWESKTAVEHHPVESANHVG